MYTVFKDDEIETLKLILNGCQQLGSINVWCGDFYLNETECSSNKFYELKIYFVRIDYSAELEFFSDGLKDYDPELEFFLEN